MSNEKRAPGCLGFIGYYTTQPCEDNTKPLEGSLLNDLYMIESKRFLFHGSDDLTLKGKITNCWRFQPLAERIRKTKKNLGEMRLPCDILGGIWVARFFFVLSVPK